MERWFAGVHSDVGGGYPEAQGGLWRVAFEWMLREAHDAGLLINEQRLQAVLRRSPEPQRAWAEPKHESLTAAWWLAEFFPKLVWRSKLKKRRPQLGLGRHRFIPPGASISKSTLLRIQDATLGYAPPNFSSKFLDKVRALPLQELPDSLPYEQ